VCRSFQNWHKHCSQNENFAYYQLCVEWVKQGHMEKIIPENDPARGNQIMFPTV
jgi:hypothetical protein